ncbi:MAG: alkaline phosphatase D family protein [Microthrixaceae bacterium]
MDRRSFLAALGAGVVTVSCSTDDDHADSTTSAVKGGVRGGRLKTVTPVVPRASTLAAGSFALGVASGDPTDTSVMLWTRLCSAPTAIDGGSPADDVEVAVDVATDPAFRNVVASTIATATGGRAHSVHVDVTGLQPDTWYHYRFRAGDQTSPVGRTRTFPGAKASPERLRFVFACCQDFQWGYYGAWKHAVAEPDLDMVVFLGDYIYETNLGDLSPNRNGERVWANQAAVSLADYRQRYAQTKGDAALQAMHHLVPWLVTWDDHEVSNNYAGDVALGVEPSEDAHRRRLAAYQAWYEHTPIRLHPEPRDFDSLKVHRSVQFGDLATTYAIEVRQHAAPAACRDPGTDDARAILTDDGPDCPARHDPGRTNIGAEQEKWLLSAMADSTTTWNILANPVMFAGLNVGTPEAPAYTRDMWDGYPVVRQRIIDSIVQNKVPNPVIVSGDWHASFVLDVHRRPGVTAEEQASPVVMPEFLVSSITTLIFPDDHRPANPHVRFFATDNAYAVVTVTPKELVCEFRNIADRWDPDTPLKATNRFTVTAGSPQVVETTE